MRYRALPWFRAFWSVFTVSGCVLARGQVELPEGEWAISPEGEGVTAILRFDDRGQVTNVSSGKSGRCFTLEDGQILLHLDDSVFVGSFSSAEDGQEHSFEGRMFPIYQPLKLRLTRPDAEKREVAKAHTEEMEGLLSESTRQRATQLIQQNLAALAAAFQMHMLLEGVKEVSYEEVVGPNRLIGQIGSVNGESYAELAATYTTTKLSVTDADGEVYEYAY